MATLLVQPEKQNAITIMCISININVTINYYYD